MQFYILAPSGVVTGGQECLHQLCSELNDIGHNACMVYYPNSNSETPEVYRKYNIRNSDRVIDLKENYLILHESKFDELYKYKNINIVNWWLSVDNFFGSSSRYLSLGTYLKYRPKLFIKAIAVKIYYFIFRRKRIIRLSISLDDLKNTNIINLCQSKYSFNFLKNESFDNLLMLEDYVNDDFHDNGEVERSNVILFNPKKGIKFTKFLIKKLPEFKWIPIINLNYEQISELMRRSKIYVDFGNHPGRDKIPREAAISGMAVITNKRGSAKFQEDIPIKEEYKFDECNLNVNKFKNTINNLFENYNVLINDYSGYRDFVKNSRGKFSAQVKELISTLKNS